MNGITTIQIGGQPVTLRFAYKCFRMFSEAQGSDKDNYWIGEGDDAALTDYAYAKLFQFAYQNDCLIKETEPVIKFEQFYDWVSERLDSPELLEVIKVWTESSTTKRIVENAAKKKEELLKMINPSTSTELKEPVTV